MERYKKLSKIYGLYMSRVLNRPLIKPYTVTITLTSRCNLRCLMCDHWRAECAEPTLSEVKGYIDQISEWDIPEIELSGGEPFVRKDILGIIDYATQKGIGMNITTNGTLFSEKNMRRIAGSNVKRLQISLDGATSEVHDRIRGVPGTYEKVMKAVGFFRGKIPVNATTVIMSHNLNQLVELYHLTKRLGFSSITYQPVNDSNIDVGSRKRHNPLRVSDLDRLDKVMDQLIGLRKMDAFIGNHPGFLSSVKDFFRDMPRERIKCYSGFISAIITPDARFWSCKGAFGNLNREGLKSAWESSAAKKKRKAIKRCRNICMYPCFLDPDADSVIAATREALR
ncbi:MAG: radical SAM protein [archaeon]